MLVVFFPPSFNNRYLPGLLKEALKTTLRKMLLGLTNLLLKNNQWRVAADMSHLAKVLCVHT